MEAIDEYLNFKRNIREAAKMYKALHEHMEAHPFIFDKENNWQHIEAQTVEAFAKATNSLAIACAINGWQKACKALEED